MSRVFAGIITYDHEPYLPYVIENVCPLVDKLFLVEGNVKEFWDLPETDYTRLLVEQSQHREKIVYRSLGKVENKERMVAEYFPLMEANASEGDWLITMGADEAWCEDAIPFLKSLDNSIIHVMFPFWNFVGDFKHFVVLNLNKDDFHAGQIFYDRSGEWMINGKYHERAYRWFGDYHYGDNHTAVRSPDEKYLYSDALYRDKRIYIPLSDEQLRWCHYGHVGRKDFMFQRRLYYLKKVYGDNRGLEYYRTKLEEEDWWWDYLTHGIIGKPDGIVEVVEQEISHPFPFENHPWRHLTREEIFNG
jgi:hypothetical protein